MAISDAERRVQLAALAKMLKPAWTTPLPEDHPDSIKYWLQIFPDNDDVVSGSFFTRIHGSIYDHIRNTTTAAMPAVDAWEAYSYIRPSGVREFQLLFQVKDLYLDGEERQCFDQDGMSDFFVLYYNIFGIPYEILPGTEFPVITRAALRHWLFMQILENSEKVRQAINEMFSSQDMLFIDPWTEAPFTCLIPKSAWHLPPEALNNPQVLSTLKANREQWAREKQNMIQIQRRKAVARAEYAREEAEEAADEAARISAAESELTDARMYARAVEYGNRVQESVFDEPGTRYEYRRDYYY